MPDDIVIKSILVEADVYSWVLAQIGNEAELFKLFKEDFKSLVGLCQE